LADLPPPVRKRRLLAYLVRRGYEGPRVKELVQNLISVESGSQFRGQPRDR